MVISGLVLFPLIILDMVIGAYRVNPIVALKAVIDGGVDPIFIVPPTIHT